MLTKPSRQALRSLYSVSQSPSWVEIDKLFKEELQKSYEYLADSRDELTLRQLQGRIKLIQEFLDVVQEAPRLLEKLKDSTL